MKTIKIISIFILSIFSLSSCTDIIELDLKNTKPRIVIEANLNLSDSSFIANLSMSNDFYENGEFKKITNANIKLSNSDGTEYIIPEINDGEYYLKNIICKPNDEFYLTVTDTDGNKYEANAKCPFPSEIALLMPVPFDPPGGGPGNSNDTAQYYQITTLWKDTVNIENYYRIKTYTNDTLNANDYVLSDDRSQDGDTLAAISIEELYPGDKYKLELLSTDKKYFDYFLDVAILYSRGPGSTTPYNPKGNFNNGALGYFGIYSVSEVEFQLPEVGFP